MTSGDLGAVQQVGGGERRRYDCCSVDSWQIQLPGAPSGDDVCQLSDTGLTACYWQGLVKGPPGQQTVARDLFILHMTTGGRGRQLFLIRRTEMIRRQWSNAYNILMYGLEAWPLKKSDIKSLDFVVDRFSWHFRPCQEHLF